MAITTVKALTDTRFLVFLLLFSCSFFLLLPAQATQSIDITTTETPFPANPETDDITSQQSGSSDYPPEKKKLIIGILSQNISTSINNSPWEFSFSLLNKHPKYQFSPQYLTIEQLIESLDNDKLDFVICDAINYLKFEKKYGILRLLTRNEQYSENFTTLEGLSVYALNDNSNITHLNDLKNKSIGVLDNNSLSWSFLEKFFSKHELTDNIDIKLFSDINPLLHKLHTKEIDAIISKSGLINKLISKEQINSLRLINPRQGWQAPFLHSSVLIPEWPLAKAWFIDDKSASLVVSTLLEPFNNDIDKSSSYFLTQYHWSIAQNYNSLLDLLPFSNDIDKKNITGQVNFSTKIQYWISFIIICFLVIILILYLHSSKDLNTRLTASKESLEQEIKERQHAQEQALNHQAELAHVARLSTMGEMASGLAHELNQPLSAINTYVQGCIRRINMGSDSEAIINALQLTAQQAERAGGIIRRLRSFVRKGETHKTYIEINHLINEVTTFLETQLKNKNINLTQELGEELPPILADIIQIEQVLVNLIKNAIEAMSDMDSSSIRLSTKRLNHNLIELCVIDSGHGISEDKLKRIFNPFFTTKSSGMGMGLSISSSIIESHGGKLYAQNNPRQGAQFCFTLPIAKEQPGKNNE